MQLIPNKDYINNLLLYLIVTFSFFSYEYTIYRNHYQFILLIVFSLGALCFFVGMTQKNVSFNFFRNIKKNILVHLLTITLLISTLSSSIKLGLVTMHSLLTIALLITSIYIFYLFIPSIILNELDSKMRKLNLLITFFSVIGIIIAIKGNFLGYTPTHYPRVASIFFDPNYFGTLCAVGFIISIYFKDNKHKVFAMLNL